MSLATLENTFIKHRQKPADIPLPGTAQHCLATGKTLESAVSSVAAISPISY